jgi:SAM-dependent methyltransferase
VLGVWVAAMVPLSAAGRDVDRGLPPPALTEYMGRVVAPPMHYAGAGWLIRNIREREEGSARMRDELGLKPGMVVCDMGSGNGYHSLPMARAVGPEGRVLAVEIQPEMLDMLGKRAAAQGVGNIDLIVGEVHDPKLPEASCDVILLVDVYHEFSHPVEMLAAMRRALKPGGNMVLVEYRAEDPEVPIKPEHKMSKEQILKEMGANGFRLTRSFDGLPWQHMMWFGRDDEQAAEASGSDAAEAAPAFELTGTDGNAHNPLAVGGGELVVVFFVSPFCPTTRPFMSEINAICAEYQGRAGFVLAHSDGESTLEYALQHQEQFEVKVPVLLDAEQKLADLAGATITPEAVVLNRKGEVLYRGRINDLYLGPTKRQRAATTRDLREALDALLAGGEPGKPWEAAQGCKIGGRK